MTLFLKDNLSDKQVANFKKAIEKEVHTKKTVFISKEQAAKNYQQDLGEDFLKFLGDNPLKDGIDMYLNADFVMPEKMKILEDKYLKNGYVSEVHYDKSLVELLTKNIQRIIVQVTIV